MDRQWCLESIHTLRIVSIHTLLTCSKAYLDFGFFSHLHGLFGTTWQYIKKTLHMLLIFMNLLAYRFIGSTHLFGTLEYLCRYGNPFWLLKRNKKIGPHFQILMQALPTSSPWRAFTTLSYYWMMLYYYILSFVCYAYWLLLYLEEKTNNSIYRYYVPNESLTINTY